MLLDIRPTPNLTKQQMWLSLFIVHLKWKNEWPHLTPFDVGWVDSDLNSTIKWFWNGNACGFIWFRLQSWFKIFDNFWIMSSSQSFQQCNDTFSFKICALFVTFATNSKNNEFSQLATEMLMTLSRCSWQTMCVGDIFLLVGDRLCCSHEIYLIVKNNAWVLTSVTRMTFHQRDFSSTFQTYHQHIWSPTSVTNIVTPTINILKLYYLNSSSSFTHSSIVWIVTFDIEITESVRSTVWFPAVVLVAFRLSFRSGDIVEGRTPVTDAPSMNDGVSQVLILNYKIKLRNF